jgi:putative phosphoesterase
VSSAEIRCVNVLTLLYDIHGNLPALEAVLADAGDVDEFLLGGDYATAGAWPRETVERLKELDSATWIRGNADRWLVERHDAPEPIDAIAARTAELLGDELVADLAELPEMTEIGDTLYCHASPRSDMESFGAEPGPLDTELLEGVQAKRVVFGHTHVQFQRSGSSGIELLNPGSVGMPWDGDHRAAYAVIDDGRVECRRVEYDWEASVAAVRERVGELPARRMELARFDVS